MGSALAEGARRRKDPREGTGERTEKPFYETRWQVFETNGPQVNEHGALGALPRCGAPLYSHAGRVAGGEHEPRGTTIHTSMCEADKGSTCHNVHKKKFFCKKSSKKFFACVAILNFSNDYKSSLESVNGTSTPAAHTPASIPAQAARGLASSAARHGFRRVFPRGDGDGKGGGIQGCTTAHGSRRPERPRRALPNAGSLRAEHFRRSARCAPYMAHGGGGVAAGSGGMDRHARQRARARASCWARGVLAVQTLDP